MKIPQVYQEKIDIGLKTGKPLIVLSLMDFKASIKFSADDFTCLIEDKKFTLLMPYGETHTPVADNEIDFDQNVKWHFKFKIFKKYVRKHLKDKSFFELLLFYVTEFKLPVIVMQKKSGAEREVIYGGEPEFPEIVKPKKEKKEKQPKFNIIKFQTLQEPSISPDWDWDNSLAKMQSLESTYNKNRAEIVFELYVAWKVLHMSPSEAGKMKFKRGEGHTWENYCKASNVSQQTAYNWFVKAKLPYKDESEGSKAGAGRKPAQINRSVASAIKNFSSIKKEKKPFIDGLKLKPSELDTKIENSNGDELIIFNKNISPKMKEVADFICFVEKGFVVYKGISEEEFIKEFSNHGLVFRKC